MYREGARLGVTTPYHHRHHRARISPLLYNSEYLSLIKSPRHREEGVGGVRDDTDPVPARVSGRSTFLGSGVERGVRRCRAGRPRPLTSLPQTASYTRLRPLELASVSSLYALLDTMA